MSVADNALYPRRDRRHAFPAPFLRRSCAAPRPATTGTRRKINTRLLVCPGGMCCRPGAAGTAGGR